MNKAKVFINKKVRSTDCNGYIQLNTVVGGGVLSSYTVNLKFQNVTKHGTKHSKLSVDKLGNWKAGFLGRLESYKLHIKENYEHGKVLCGNVVREWDTSNGTNGNDYSVGCFIAAFDDEVLYFEVHYNTGAIERIDGADIITIKEVNQIATQQMKQIDRSDSLNNVKLSSPRKEHGNSNLSAEYVRIATYMLKVGDSCKNICTHLSITDAKKKRSVSNLKAKLKKSGEL